MQQHRNTLNKGQITVLELLYKFRFGSSDLLAEHFGKPSGVYLYKRLNILVERGLVGKRYDSSYRLRGLPAAYYLRPDGYRVIQEMYDDSSRTALAYKALSVSEDHVHHCLRIFTVYNTLKKQYGNKIKFYAQNDMSDLDLPKVKPDVYLILSDTKHFFLDVCSTPQQLAAEYIKFRSYDAWIDQNGYDQGFITPAILVVGSKLSSMRKLNGKNKVLEASVAYATLDNLRQESATWQLIDGQDRLSLHDIS